MDPTFLVTFCWKTYKLLTHHGSDPSARFIPLLCTVLLMLSWLKFLVISWNRNVAAVSNWAFYSSGISIIKWFKLFRNLKEMKIQIQVKILHFARYNSKLEWNRKPHWSLISSFIGFYQLMSKVYWINQM